MARVLFAGLRDVAREGSERLLRDAEERLLREAEERLLRDVEELPWERPERLLACPRFERPAARTLLRALTRSPRALVFRVPRPLLCRAPAFSLDTSLLKLLCSPLAVRSCTNKARLLSSNFWNHSSQLISSRESSPL